MHAGKRQRGRPEAPVAWERRCALIDPLLHVAPSPDNTRHCSMRPRADRTGAYAHDGPAPIRRSSAGSTLQRRARGLPVRAATLSETLETSKLRPQSFDAALLAYASIVLYRQIDRNAYAHRRSVHTLIQTSRRNSGYSETLAPEFRRPAPLRGASEARARRRAPCVNLVRSASGSSGRGLARPLPYFP